LPTIFLKKVTSENNEVTDHLEDNIRGKSKQGNNINTKENASSSVELLAKQRISDEDLLFDQLFSSHAGFGQEIGSLFENEDAVDDSAPSTDGNADSAENDKKKWAAILAKAIESDNCSEDELNPLMKIETVMNHVDDGIFDDFADLGVSMKT